MGVAVPEPVSVGIPGPASVGVVVPEPVSVGIPGPASVGVVVPEPVSVGIPGPASVGVAVPEPVSVGIPGPASVGVAVPEPVRVLLHPSMAQCLSSLSIRCPHQQVKLWMDQKQSFTRAASLIKAFGKPSLTSLQAKKLYSLGLSFEDLSKLYRETGAGDAFQTALKDRGVNSKLLRGKLGKALSPFR